MKQTEPAIEFEEKLWQNDLDLKKSLIQVHDNEFTKILGPDFKLAKLTDQQREFIMDMLGLGSMALDLVPNPDIAAEIKNMDFLYIKAIAVLNFNHQENMIVDRSTAWQQPEKEDRESIQEGDKWIDKLKAKLGTKKTDE